MENQELMKAILNETGSTNVDKFYFNEELQKWIVQYKSELDNDVFELFSDMYEFLSTEGND